MADEIAAAHHEAAHSVAALMTVNKELDEQAAATLTRIDGGPAGGNIKVSNPGDHPLQTAFIYYAGPWAEARSQWGRPVHSLDDTNDDGMSFRRFLAETCDYTPGSDGACLAALTQAVPSIPDNESYWMSELEKAWPVIGKLAGALRDRLKAAEPRPHLPEWGGNRTIRSASMTYLEVVGLVGPLLQAGGMWRYLS